MLLKLSIMSMFMIRYLHLTSLLLMMKSISIILCLMNLLWDQSELIDDYDKLWAEVLDETNQSVSGESMMTAQPGWDSEQEERDSFVMDKIHGENMQAKDFLQVPACTKLRDEVPGTINECTVPGNMEGCKAGNVEAGKQGEEGSHMSVDGMKKGKITGKGSNYFTWLNFKFNQCMSATWINGTPSGALNTLKTRDLTENCFMMGKSSRDTHDTKRSTLQGKNPKAKSLVSTPFISKLSSLCTDTQKELTSIPLLSSSPSLTESSPSSQHNTINPLKLFSAIDIALDNLSLHHEGKGGTEDSSASFLSSASFPSLANSPYPLLLSHSISLKFYFHLLKIQLHKPWTPQESTQVALATQSMVAVQEALTSTGPLVPTDWTAAEQALIGQLGLEKYVETCRDKDEAVAWEAINNYNATTKENNCTRYITGAER